MKPDAPNTPNTLELLELLELFKKAVPHAEAHHVRVRPPPDGARPDMAWVVEGYYNLGSRMHVYLSFYGPTEMNVCGEFAEYLRKEIAHLTPTN